MILHTIPLFVVLLFLLGCTTPVPKVTIDYEKPPKYFGSSGLTLYAATSVNSQNDEFLLDSQSEATTLYKLYIDVAIFLTDEIQPDPAGSSLSGYAVFGNPRHANPILNQYNEDWGYQIVGFLDSKDVVEVADFLKEKNLSSTESMKTYFDSLSQPVQEELEMLQGDKVIPHVGFYLHPMIDFYEKCKAEKKAVVLVFYP